MIRHTRNILMLTLGIALAVALIAVLLCETDTLPVGVLSGRGGSDEFVLTMLMELLTLCAIPLALRLFRFKAIAARLTSAAELLRWGMVRMLMLCLPMVANTFLYYIYMNVAFGYMAIILLLSLYFVLPTMARCEVEINDGSLTAEHQQDSAESEKQ